MAITRTGGTAANSSASVSSLAFSSITPTTGRNLVFVIALGSTSSSVSSISNSAGSYSGMAMKAAVNGSGVRTEIWGCSVTTGANTVFTVNITGGATSIAQAVEEYNGATSGFGNTGTSSNASSIHARNTVVLQDGNNFMVTGIGWACSSGDSLTNDFGTQVLSSVPAATAVGIYLIDYTQTVSSSLSVQDVFANGGGQVSRAWAAAGVELRTGATAITVYSWDDLGAPAAIGDAEWQTGHPNIVYQNCREPLFCELPIVPPPNTNANWGFVGF